MPVVEIVTNLEVQNLPEFHQWVETLKNHLRGDEIILLSGQMGAGKTEFVKTLAALYGINAAASPTFALHHSMSVGDMTLDHYDLYRLESVEDLETTGFWDVLQSPSLVLIEWPEKVPNAYWPRDRRILQIEIVKTTEQARRINWSELQSPNQRA